MIERIKGQDSLDLEAIEVLEMYRSINENLMSAEGHPSQPSRASVIGGRKDGEVKLYVHYFMIDDRAGLLYEETDPLTPKTYAAKRDEAMESVESMGFILDNVQLKERSADEQISYLEGLPAFGGGEAQNEEDELEEVEEVTDSTTSSDEQEVDLDDDPETILILEEAEAKGPVASHAEPKGVADEMDQQLWKVFFRMVASL